ncbi:hypothetical protein RCL1_008839 [Eukaryota sp. TZLM3-RCL]
MANFECSICLTQCNDASFIPCGHSFCFECIRAELSERQRCPLCRRNCSIQDIGINFELRRAIEEQRNAPVLNIAQLCCNYLHRLTFDISFTVSFFVLLVSLAWIFKSNSRDPIVSFYAHLFIPLASFAALFFGVKFSLSVFVSCLPIWSFCSMCYIFHLELLHPCDTYSVFLPIFPFLLISTLLYLSSRNNYSFLPITTVVSGLVYTFKLAEFIDSCLRRNMLFCLFVLIFNLCAHLFPVYLPFLFNMRNQKKPAYACQVMSLLGYMIYLLPIMIQSSRFWATSFSVVYLVVILLMMNIVAPQFSRFLGAVLLIHFFFAICLTVNSITVQQSPLDTCWIIMALTVVYVFSRKNYLPIKYANIVFDRICGCFWVFLACFIFLYVFDHHNDLTNNQFIFLLTAVFSFVPVFLWKSSTGFLHHIFVLVPPISLLLTIKL